MIACEYSLIHGLICDTSVKHAPQHDQLPLHLHIFSILRGLMHFSASFSLSVNKDQLMGSAPGEQIEIIYLYYCIHSIILYLYTYAVI